jgi:transcription antitermination factor NusG
MSDQLKWYVVRAISGKEKKVKQYIDAEISRLGITHLSTAGTNTYRKILPDARWKKDR